MTRLEKIEAMLADSPNDPELHYMLAMEHVSLGNDTAAVSSFEKLVQVSPDYAPAYHQAGRVLQRLNRDKEAGAILRQGIAVAVAKGNDHAAGEMQALLESLE